MYKELYRGNLFGTIIVPPSKSDSQRALLAASLASGSSHIYNVGSSDDEKAMLRNVRALGAEVRFHEQYVEILGPLEKADSIQLNVGESGLGLRLMLACTLAHASKVVLDGEGSLLNRSQHFLEHQLIDLGIGVQSRHSKLPLRLEGMLKSGRYQLDGSTSSQFLSGLLMSFPLISGETELLVDNLRSSPYIQMTLQTMESFGVYVKREGYERFVIRGSQNYQAQNYAVEGDWSAASNWLVAAALGHKLKVLGLTLESIQADKAILDALQAASCIISIDEQGISVDGSSRSAFDFDCTHCPDLFPALVCLAAHCEGESRIFGANRLIHKESNRAEALIQEYAKIGIKVKQENDSLVIEGGKVKGSLELHSHHDHRIAMSLAIACLSASQDCALGAPDSVAKSYPEFWEHLDACRI